MITNIVRVLNSMLSAPLELLFIIVLTGSLRFLIMDARMVATAYVDFGRPNFGLVAISAPGFITAGWQLFQWTTSTRGVPSSYAPTPTSKQDLPRRWVIG